MPFIDVQYSGKQIESLRSGYPGRIDFRQIQSPEQMQKAVATIRKLCLVEMTKPLAMPDAEIAMRRLSQMSQAADGMLHIGSTHIGESVESPDSHTVNMVFNIGFQDSPGTIDIASSAAFGLRWRLSGDHALVQDYPQLGRFEVSEAEQEALPHYGKVYVQPRELDRAMLKVTDTSELESNLLAFIKSLGGFSLHPMTTMSIEPEWRHLDKNFNNFSIAIHPKDQDSAKSPYARPIAELRFKLHPNGLKLVEISGLNHTENLPSEDDRRLAQAAWNIWLQNSLFYKTQ